LERRKQMENKKSAPQSPDSFLTKIEVEEFKKIVKELYGFDLNNSEAEDQGRRLIQIFELIQRFELNPDVGKRYS